MPPLRSLDGKGAVLALLLSALWGGTPVAVKVGLASVPALRLAWMRFVLGGLAILAWAGWIGHRDFLRIRPGEARVLLNLGLLFTVQIGLMNIGIAHTTAAHASVVLNSYAVHTVVLAHFFIPGDRMTAHKLGGVLVAYAGILLLFARDLSFQSATLAGDLVVSASALLLGERTVYLARAVQRLDPIKLLIYQAAIGSAAFLLVSLWWEAGVPSHYTPSLALSLLYQGAVVAGFNFLVNSRLLQIYRPSALVPCFLTTPVFGVLIAAVVTGERLSPTLLLSAAMVAAGIGISSRR